MPKLLRKTQKIFGSNTINLGKFGSAQTGVPDLSPATDLADMQSLPAYELGWGSALLGGKRRPPLEEENTIKYINDYQNAYLFQEGIAEYDAGTTYFIGSIVKQTGTSILFKSLVDNNLGNALVDGINWLLLGDLATLSTLGIGNALKLQGVDISAAAPISGDRLQYSGAVWRPYTKSNAAMYFNGNATPTVIGALNTPVKINATYLSEELVAFTHLAGRLTYTGTLAKKFIFNTSVSFLSATNNRKISIYFAVNGVVIPKTKKTTSTNQPADGANLNSLVITTLNLNDYVECFIEANEIVENITVTELYTLITEL